MERVRCAVVDSYTEPLGDSRNNVHNMHIMVQHVIDSTFSGYPVTIYESPIEQAMKLSLEPVNVLSFQGRVIR